MGWINLPALAAIFAFGAGPLVAEPDLVLWITVDGAMSGSRPWDGTGISSAAMDASSGAGSFFDFARGMGLQAGLDQANSRMAPADPYVCFISPNRTPALACNDAARQDTSTFDLSVPARYASLPAFGVRRSASCSSTRIGAIPSVGARLGIRGMI